MPPLSPDDYYKLLQKMTVLEAKIQRLEVNVQVNGLCGNDTTLLWKDNGQDPANMQLISTNNPGKKQEDKNTSTDSPRWNALGAKPKSKPFHREKEGRLTGRAQFAEITDATGWPALPSRPSTSSTPLPSKTESWPVVKRKFKNKPPHQQPDIQQQNRFSPLLQDPGSPSDNLDDISRHTKVRPKNKSESKRQRKQTAGPETLIVGDFGVKDVGNVCGKRTKVLCFPKDMVSDVAERILKIVGDHPTVKNLVLHVGSNDVVKQQSEVLKRDFTKLLNTITCLGVPIFISGPLPPVKGAERFSRLYNLNAWLSAACGTHSVHFIDNFNFFWDRRHYFNRNGFTLNKQGVRLYASNLFYFLNRHCVPLEKENMQARPKQHDKTEHSGHIRITPPHPPPAPGEDHLPYGSFLDPNPRTNNQDDGPFSPPQTPDRSLSSLLSPSSPSSPHLKFTEPMMERVNIALRSTPQTNTFLSSINPLLGRSTVKHPARPPSAPLYKLQTLSPQSDV